MNEARCAARLQQALINTQQLLKHQKLAIALLTLSEGDRLRLIQGAQNMVAVWETKRLCSSDYIERWRAILELPFPELSMALVDDHDGWGAALRQNSPWIGAVP